MGRIGLAAKGALRAGGELIWPSRALVSGRRDVGEGALPPEEWVRLTFITGPVCDACGQPQESDYGALATCAACQAKPPLWQRARAALVYDEHSRRPVLDLKRAARRDGLGVMASWMMQAGGALLAESDVLIPVPLHYRRLVLRGYNQAGWLASGLSRRSGVPVRVDVLKRVRATPSQGGKSRRARARNVAGAFAVPKRKQRAIAGKRVLLIDDVLTTGATLRGCARILLRAGASEVNVLTLARVVRTVDVSI